MLNFELALDETLAIGRQTILYNSAFNIHNLELKQVRPEGFEPSTF